MGKFYQGVGDSLTLAVRQLAWLNTAPVEANKKPSDQDERLTRREQMERDEVEVPLPETDAEFLLGYLLDIGPVLSAGMGSAAIGWRDVEAWQRCSGVALSPWQSRLIVRLSAEYLSFSQKASKPDCPAPWLDEAQIESRREAVARSLSIGFQALIDSKPKGLSKPKRKGG